MDGDAPLHREHLPCGSAMSDAWWMWSFRLTGDTLRGTLDNPAGVTWRNIVVARQNTSARAQ